MRSIPRGVGIVYVTFCLVSLMRIGIELFFSTEAEPFVGSVYIALIMVSYQTLVLLLTFSIFLMVNRALNLELDRDRDLTQLRLALWEYAANNSLEALMRRALDEIGVLTHSPIGFYHFIEPDQRRFLYRRGLPEQSRNFVRPKGRACIIPWIRQGFGSTRCGSANR